MISDIQELEKKFTKYEIARILGARALQIAMDAPLLAKISREELESLKYDPIKIAEIELRTDVLPITVKRPLPGKTEKELTEEPAEEEEKDDKKKEDEKIVKIEEKEEKEIKESGEIMAIASPGDEGEELGGEEGEEGGVE